MTDHPLPPTSDRAWHPVAGLVWSLASLAVAVLGFLLFSVSDWQMERVAGVLLLAAAAVGLVTGMLALRGAGPDGLPVAASSGLVVAGVVAAVLVATRDGAFLVDVLVVGAVPVAAGVGTFLLHRRRPR